MKLSRVTLVSALFCATAAHAQGWSPQRNVELVVGFVPGGGMDRTARSLDRILVGNKLVTSGVTVVNKPGGSLEDVVKITIFMVNIKNNTEVWRARREFFSGDFPASTLVEVRSLAGPETLVEIEAVAYLGKS